MTAGKGTRAEVRPARLPLRSRRCLSGCGPRGRRDNRDHRVTSRSAAPTTIGFSSLTIGRRWRPDAPTTYVSRPERTRTLPSVARRCQRIDRCADKPLTSKRPPPIWKGPFTSIFLVAGAGFEPATFGYEIWVRLIRRVCTSEQQGRLVSQSSWSVSTSVASWCVLIGSHRRREVSGALTKALTRWG